MTDNAPSVRLYRKPKLMVLILSRYPEEQYAVRVINAGASYIELSVLRSFMDEYIQALFLPHTDLNAFPTVKHQMRKAKTWYPPE
jgi:hypothetical protein